MRKRVLLRVLILMATVAAGGSLFQIGCAREIAANLNPCGTILSTNFCTPQQWAVLFVEPQDWDYDPTCTIPTLCGPFPGEAGVGTTTSTTTTTGTGLTGFTGF